MNRSTDGLRSVERIGLHCLGLSATVGFASVLYLLVMRPSSEAQADDLQHRDHLREVVASKEDAMETFVQLRKQHNELNDQISEVNRRLPKDSNVNLLLSEVSNLAEQHSLKVLSVQPMQKHVGDLAAYQHVKCRVLGTYDDLCKFIDGMNRLESLVWTTGTEIASESTTKRLQPIELDMALLYAPEDTAVGKISLEIASSEIAE